MASEILKRDENHEPVIGLVTDDSNQFIKMGRIDDATKGLKVMLVGGAGTGTVTSISQSTGILLTPNPITTTGTVALSTPIQPIASLAGNSLKFLRVNAGETAVEYANPTDTGMTQLTGDVTAGPGSGSQAATIASNAVTYAKMQAVSTTSKLLGSSSTTTPVQEITLGSGLSLTGTTLSATGSGGTVTSVASADGSITVTNPTSTVDLAVVKAPKLTTARTINGTSFDGTANITVTAAAGTLTGTTLNATVVSSSLTSVGTIGTGVWNGTVIGPAFGGTGVANNAASTLTISGNFATTLTVSNTTSVTLPTSGTLYGTASGSITSAQLATSLSDETGSGAAVFATSPTLVTPALGTPTALVGTNITGTGANFTSGITNALASATTTVNVSSATAPTSGQILTATSGTAATWQTPASSNIPNWVDEGTLTWSAENTDKTLTLTNTGNDIYMGIIFFSSGNNAAITMQLNGVTATNYTTTKHSDSTVTTTGTAASFSITTNATGAMATFYITGKHTSGLKTITGTASNIAGGTGAARLMDGQLTGDSNNLSTVTILVGGTTVSAKLHMYSLNL